MRGEDDCQETVKKDLPKLAPLECVPVELTEFILSHLRPADLVSVASLSSHLESITRSARLWRQTTVQLSGNDVRSSLRQIELARELREIQAGFSKLSFEAADAILKYSGPIPKIQKLRLGVSILGVDMAIALFSRHFQTARQLEIDLSHSLLEAPRNHVPLLTLLPAFAGVDGISIRTDSVSDINVLKQLPLKLVDIDLRGLRVDLDGGGYGPTVGATAAQLISLHTNHLHRLSLPWNHNVHLTGATSNCTQMQELACNVWTLPVVQNLINLRSLVIYAPRHLLTQQDIGVFLIYAQQSQGVLARIKELRFIDSGAGDVLSPVASSDIMQAIMFIFLSFTDRLEVLEIGWKVKLNIHAEWTWLNALLSKNDLWSLREIRIHGNILTYRDVLPLVKYCPDLKLLDIRMLGVKDGDVKFELLPMMKRVSSLAKGALPELTILFQDAADTTYDWNCYLDSEANVDSEEAEARLCPSSVDEDHLKDDMDRLVNHLLVIDPSRDFAVPPGKDVHLWRYASLDPTLVSYDRFADLLKASPALGLLNCLSQYALRPRKKVGQWMERLILGPRYIRALKLRAVLVAPCHWIRVLSILRRSKDSLRCLELDFRGRPFRNWRDVLHALGELTNLTELVLRGVFDDDKPVLDWLHGRVRSLRRLDLRDCMMKDKRMPAFIPSLQKLLVELRGTLRAVALPPLPKKMASPALRTVSELTDLHEVALHANEIEKLFPLRSLCALEIYGDRRRRNTISQESFSRSLRNISEALRGVERLTLPVVLVESQSVREAILDVAPNLRMVHVVYPDRRFRVCAEGPRCRILLSDWSKLSVEIEDNFHDSYS